MVQFADVRQADRDTGRGSPDTGRDLNATNPSISDQPSLSDTNLVSNDNDRRSLQRSLAEDLSSRNSNLSLLTPEQQRVLNSIDVSYNDNLEKLQQKLMAHPEYIELFVNKQGDIVGTNSDLNKKVETYESDISFIKQDLEEIYVRNPQLKEFAESYYNFNGTSREFAKSLGANKFVGNYKAIINRVNELRAVESKLDRELASSRVSPGIEQMKKLNQLIDAGMLPELQESYDTSKIVSLNMQNFFIPKKEFSVHIRAENDRLLRDAAESERQMNPPMSAEVRETLLRARQPGVARQEMRQRVLESVSEISESPRIHPEVAREQKQRIDVAQKAGSYSLEQAELMKGLTEFRESLATKGQSSERMAGWIEANEFFKDQLRNNNLTIADLNQSKVPTSSNHSVLRVMAKELNNKKLEIFEEAIRNNLRDGKNKEAENLLSWLKNDTEIISLTKDQITKLEKLLKPEDERINPFSASEDTLNYKFGSQAPRSFDINKDGRKIRVDLSKMAMNEEYQSPDGFIVKKLPDNSFDIKFTEQSRWVVQGRVGSGSLYSLTKSLDLTA